VDRPFIYLIRDSRVRELVLVMFRIISQDKCAHTRKKGVTRKHTQKVNCACNGSKGLNAYNIQFALMT